MGASLPPVSLAACRGGAPVVILPPPGAVLVVLFLAVRAVQCLVLCVEALGGKLLRVYSMYIYDAELIL